MPQHRLKPNFPEIIAGPAEIVMPCEVYPQRRKRRIMIDIGTLRTHLFVRIQALPLLLFGKAFDPPLILFADVNNLVHDSLEGVEIMKGFDLLTQPDG